MTNGSTTEIETTTLPAPRTQRPPVPVPATIGDQLAMAQVVIKSGLAPSGFKAPEAVVVALQMGAELGLLPMQSLRLISVINGKPSLGADGCAAVVMASGLCEYLYAETSDATACTMVTKRRGYPSPVRYTYTIQQAQAAGLVGRNPVWRSYPERMLKARATSYLCRDVYADVVGGLLSAEEVADLTDAPAPAAATRTAAPAATSQAAPATDGMPRRRAKAAEPAPAPAGDVIEAEAVMSAPVDAETVADVFDAPLPPDGPRISESQRKRIFALAKEAGRTHEEVKGWLGARGITSTTEVPTTLYDALCAWIAGDVEPGAEESAA